MTKTPTTHRETNLSTFKPKQLNVIQVSTDPKIKYMLNVGAIRSGKTIVSTAVVLFRAMRAPGSQHLICHAFGNVAFRNLFQLTVPETFEYLWPGYYEELRADKESRYIRISDREIILPNGSKIMFLGLDDANKIRGQRFSTIFVNECNFVDYATINTLEGRLSEAVATIDGAILETKMLFDCNPTVKSSWEYQRFIEGKVPGDGTPLPSRARHWHGFLNTIDNKDNLPDDYFEVFEAMSAEQRAKDEFGMYAEDNPNALFELSKIKRRFATPDDMKILVVGVDPAGSDSATADNTGIIMAGIGHDDQYYVFGDYTMKAKPEVWAQKAVDLYKLNNAQWVVAEKNYGGQMVETVLSRATIGGKNVPIKLVNARKGKRLRAEPIQVLYERGMVNHVPDPNKPMQFRELEQQMVEFDSPGFKGSPDRVDALVWALTFLSEHQAEPSHGGFVGYFDR